MSVDPLAQDFAAWSGYNYVLGNPVMMVDPDGKMPVGPGDPPSLWDRIKDYGNEVLSSLESIVSLSGSGDGGEFFRAESQKVEKINKAIDDGLTVVENGLKVVETTADVVEIGALGTTVASGGTAAPITAPLAGGASTISTVSLISQAGIQILRDGEVSTQTSQDLAISIVFTGAGKVAGKQVDNILDGYSKPHAPSDKATRTTADGFLKVVEETTKGQVIKDDENK